MTFARFDPHALEGDRLGFEGLGVAVGEHRVGFARSTDGFAPPPGFVPILPGKMGTSKWSLQLGWQPS